MTHIQLAQQAEAQKQQIEANRILPTDLIHEVKKAGLPKRWATQTVGGEEAAVSEVTTMLREMAYHNGSLAWVVGVTGCSALFAGFVKEEQAWLLFEDPMSMVGGFAGPAGVAKLVDGGVEVSGHWTWGSGISHCSHIVGGVRLMKGEEMQGTGIVFFEPSEIDMIDNWQVLGLKGTHSIDYQATKVFIPNERWSIFPVAQAVADAPLYNFSFLGALSMSIASVGLGLAQRALAEIKTLATTKRPFGQGKPLARRPEIQQRVGKVEGNYQAAIALFEQTIAKAEKEAVTGPCSIAIKGQVRLASAHATSLAHAVVQEAFDIAGGSAVWQSHKLEELIRDMNVVKQHGMVNGLNYRTVGAVVLGQEVPSVLL